MHLVTQAVDYMRWLLAVHPFSYFRQIVQYWLNPCLETSSNFGMVLAIQTLVTTSGSPVSVNRAYTDLLLFLHTLLHTISHWFRTLLYHTGLRVGLSKSQENLGNYS